MYNMTGDLLKAIKREYPIGCEVVLERMDDTQAPPIGTHGKVTGVDDLGTIHISWDNDSSLGVAYGVDKCSRVENEPEEEDLDDEEDDEEEAESEETKEVIGVLVSEKPPVLLRMPPFKTISEQTDFLHTIIECDIIDITTRKIGGKYYDIVCDDEGLFKERPRVSAVMKGTYEPALVGNLFICLNDKHGNLTSIDEEDAERIFNEMGIGIASYGDDDDIQVLHVVSVEY